MRIASRAALFVLAASSFFLANCQTARRTYAMTGRVISKQPVTQQIVVNNDDIPGFMPSMTMPYQVKDPEGLKKVEPADVIRARIVVGPQDRYWLEQIQVTGKEPPPQANPQAAPQMLMIGQSVPEVPMVNQDGKTIHFSQFKGKTVLLTFIYTRCPFQNYCPLLSHQFSVIQETLASNPNEYRDTHLISISLDPAYDKPPVLRQYGLKYVNNDPHGFEHWDFVSTTAKDLQTLTASFGLQFQREDGQISHSMNTILLARDGTVAQMWPGNEWQTAEVLDVTRRALEYKN